MLAALIASVVSGISAIAVLLLTAAGISLVGWELTVQMLAVSIIVYALSYQWFIKAA